MRKIIRKAGNSNQVSIPAEICKKLGMHPGTVIDIEQVENKIVMTPLEVIEKN